MSQASKRGWLRFSLRAMLIVVTFIAVLLGLWAQRARNQRAGVAWVHEPPLTNLPRLETVGLMIEVHPNTDLSPLHSLKHLQLLRLDYTGLELTQLQPLRAALPNCRIESATDRDLNADPISPPQE